jgi:hypothetical protein
MLQRPSRIRRDQQNVGLFINFAQEQILQIIVQQSKPRP